MIAALTRGTIYIGYGGSGSYSLTGSGVLAEAYEYVGYSGTGTFTQSGGTNGFITDYGGLFVGYWHQLQRQL